MSLLIRAQLLTSLHVIVTDTQCFMRLFCRLHLAFGLSCHHSGNLGPFGCTLHGGSAKLFPRVSFSFFFLFNHRKRVAPISSVDITAHVHFHCCIRIYTPHTNVQFHVLYSSILNFDGYLRPIGPLVKSRPDSSRCS